MEEEQKKVIEKIILDQIRAKKKDITKYALLTKPVSPDNAIGRISRMEAINSKSINDAALNNAKDTLSKLERALAQLDNPDFGMCRECGDPIPSARIIILPETDICAPCAEEMNG